MGILRRETPNKGHLGVSLRRMPIAISFSLSLSLSLSHTHTHSLSLSLIKVLKS